jgi:hypothetical protein
MIIKKYQDFLIFESKKGDKKEDWKDKYECRLVSFKGKTGDELKEEIGEFLSDQENVNNLDNPKFLNCVEEKTVIEGIINNLKKIETRYWDRTLSSFFTLLVMLMLYNGIKVDQGTREKADEKLKEITGQTIDKDSKQDNVKKATLDSEKMNKQYKDNIDKLKSELNKERKLKEKMESNLKKYQEEKEKLEKEKKELEKKNKELKEKQRLEEIKNKLNKLDVKITGKPNKKD